MTQSQSPGLCISRLLAIVGHYRQSLYDMLAPLLGICPGGYSIKFYTGRLRPELNLLPLFIPFFTEKASLSYAFFLSHT